ncbi:MAG TPA: protein kinase [Thermoanaerobaculia bacterium]|nr:protein kinase [Thermoanaerobaculia bacterium]
MSLAQGSKLGRYEILHSIGAGGMGEVYRAKDSTLHRDVALKILPEALVADRTRLLRFEQEARATAALHHPNIVTIHDFGTSGAMPYLVTELLEGESLLDVVVRGPVPLRRAVGWSLQILRGLAAAHGRGIVHRDLKPANLFVLADGSVKILDFGLAKVTEHSRPATDDTTVRISEAGTVLGTIGYMAPEQIRGEPADARSDIFSFAVVLYELLTGRSPFLRASSAETIAAIRRDEPPRLETALFPSALATTLERCLAKEPDQRFHSAHDLALHLETIELAASGATAVVTSDASTAGQPRLEQVTFRRGHVMAARFAPDGSIVYGAVWNDQPLGLYVSHRGLAEARALNIGASIHAVSRNGELAISLGRKTELGFQNTGTLARVGITGGAPRPIANDVYEADWSPDGKQLAICRRDHSLFQIEYPIGRPVYQSPYWISDMRISPDGKEIAFFEHPFAGDNQGYVKVIDLHGDAHQLTDRMYIASGLAWHPAGEVWYTAAPEYDAEARGMLLWAVSRKSRPREVYSAPTLIVLRDIAADGKVLVATETLRRLIVCHVEGEEVDRDLSWFDWSFPMRLSGDGKTLLLEEQGLASRGRYTFYLRPADGGEAVRLEEGRARDLSPDGEYVLAFRDELPGHLLLVPTGAGELREIPLRGPERIQSARFLPSGREIVVIGARAGEPLRLWRLPIEGGDALPVSEPIVNSWFFFALAPDGERMAVLSEHDTPLICSLDPEIGAIAVPGALRGDSPVHWPSEHVLLVCQREERQSQIFSIDLRSGARTFVRTMRPSDAAGVRGVFPIHYAAQNDSYVFGYRLLLSELFIAEGLR